MASDQQIAAVINRLNEVDPMEFARTVNATQVGLVAVLRYLYESEGVVTAGKISEFMNVSTARVAALLKKLVAKGLVTREADLLDARITIVKITNLGVSVIQKKKEEMFQQVGTVIDRVGMERMMDFIKTLEEIKTAVKGPDPNL